MLVTSECLIVLLCFAVVVLNKLYSNRLAYMFGSSYHLNALQVSISYSMGLAQTSRETL